MPTKSFWHAYVQCPFYRSDDGRSEIRCEGVCDGSILTQQYQAKEDFLIQIRVFCSDHFRKCELYDVLERKYEN